MKQVKSISKLAMVKGGGCYKYLRRMDRNIRRGDDDQAVENFYQYLSCMNVV